MANGTQTINVAWTVSSILTLAFTTGVVTAVFNQGIAWAKETWQRRHEDRRSARGLALNLVESLTSYAQDCNALAQQNRAASEIGNYGDDRIPDLAPYDDQGPWGALSPKIAGSLRDFRNEVQQARQAVAITREEVGPPEAIDTATYQLNHLGYMASEIVLRLRKAYNFGSYAGRSSFAVELRQQHKKNQQGLITKLWRSRLVLRVRRPIRRQIRHFLRSLQGIFDHDGGESK